MGRLGVLQNNQLLLLSKEPVRKLSESDDSSSSEHDASFDLMFSSICEPRLYEYVLRANG